MAYETEDHETQYCFPAINSSCIKEKRSRHEYNVCVFFIAVSMDCVLNLLLIISISHFKKLHTPTNLIILSLAVADLLMGLVMPIEATRLTETCWYFGDTLCGFYSIFIDVPLSASLSNLFLVAVDRYVAVCHPLLYPQKLTTTKTLMSICLICYVAHQQVKVINSLIKGGKCVMEGSVRRKSERKAALTLGIIVTVYLLCYIHTICSISVISSTTINVLTWVLYTNSGLNPLVYALFYPWFKKTVKHILTLKIFQPASSLIDIFTQY